MADLTAWQKALDSRLAGVSPGVVNVELAAAIRDYFLESRAWRMTIGPADLTAPSATQTFTVDVNTDVVWIHGVWLEGTGVTRTDLAAETVRRTDGQTGLPRRYTTDSVPNVIRYHPTPDVTFPGVVWADVSLAPSAVAVVFPDIAVTHHFNGILEGALWRVFRMPNKPWTDAVAANIARAEFQRRVLEARALSDQSYLRTDPGFRFPPWA